MSDHCTTKIQFNQRCLETFWFNKDTFLSLIVSQVIFSQQYFSTWSQTQTFFSTHVITALGFFSTAYTLSFLSACLAARSDALTKGPLPAPSTINTLWKRTHCFWGGFYHFYKIFITTGVIIFPVMLLCVTVSKGEVDCQLLYFLINW